MKYGFEKISGAFILLFTVTGAIGQNTFPTTGNTGIGTTSPQEKLQVVGSVKINASSSLDLAYTKISWNRPIGSGATVFDNHRDLGDVGFIFNTTTGVVGSPVTELMRLKANGNVGIGTSVPAGILDVLATSTGTDPQIFFRAQISGNNQNSNSPRLNLTGMDQTAGFGMQAINMGGYGVKDLVFTAHNASDYVTYTEVVRFKYNGNVGIGTANPANKLDVAGSGGWSVINCQALDNNTTTRLKFTNSTNRTWSISNLAPPYANNDFSIADETANAVRFFINNSGNVGIGTTAPGTNRLAVEGTIAARKVKVTQAIPWPDYVFDSSYALLALDEVGDYIKDNKHLPDLPSAGLVAKEGLDLGDNQAVLLRKIEELTLYILQQQKELKIQSAKISVLEKSLLDK